MMKRFFFVLSVLLLVPILLSGTEISKVSVATDGTEGNKSSFWPRISDDGRYVTFISRADNLVPGDTNGFEDIFVNDRRTGETRRVNVSSDGTQTDNVSWGSRISSDGSYIVFYSHADKLVPGDTNNSSDIFVHYRKPARPRGLVWLPTVLKLMPVVGTRTFPLMDVI